MPLLHPCTGFIWHNQFSASGRPLPKPSVLFHNPHRVSLKGVKIDSVGRLGDVWNPDWTASLDPRSTLRYLSEVRMFCARSNRINKSVKLATAGQIAVRGLFCQEHSEFIEDWEKWDTPEDFEKLKDSEGSEYSEDTIPGS